MKKAILFVFALTLSYAVIAQSKKAMVLLPQIYIMDLKLEKMLREISTHSCFQDAPDRFFLVDFYVSELSDNHIYLNIKPLTINESVIRNIEGYKLIQGKYFLFPKHITSQVISVIPGTAKFMYLETPIPYMGGDYRFLIEGFINVYYQILYSTCSE